MTEEASIVKGADWVLCEERGPGVPEGIYGVACMTCEARSPLFDDDQLPVAVWAIQHVQQEPAHRQFIATTERHWRVHPRSGPTPPAPDSFLQRAAGPAFVGLMCLLTALAGLLPAALN
ncbi:hypothetical protein FH609_015180 [Streptomyces sp. 3MP-14]|uniref:DUF7848 domain-containing protein n=1 Tax=Streptomyces mimosae TaxID=2586635 RepID=A0A5N6AAB0_9ACTN|nr:MULTISPECIES: hypothetical protein [Streptomyces]KAB8165754.1 hypothetical protein FH607_012505 [Streptomyces mimosae]KAB8176143.1 hypothetical protein FH609_015180 [Streptomyces sp. 3MP-14]